MILEYSHFLYLIHKPNNRNKIMTFDNLINVSFSQEELAALDQAIQSIVSTLSGKTVNLTLE
ncbi:hypothetical protein BCF50_0588 [Chryseobacterium daecheongense]|uniref:Uncharacterized protein n=1 Tax=Chryseobacterium daecheongense TaxID=192389 RepID=A0ABY2FZ82_9FLAO|nr:hypothetical protein BCF50_0588 [Chryseobacterium daecheongense]